MIWKIIWLAISAFVIFITTWSLSILFKQKKAWKEFAKKYKMRHLSGGFFDSPEIKGRVYGHDFHIFTAKHSVDDERRKKYRTVIEVRFKNNAGIKGVFATGELTPIAEYINLPEKPDVNYAGWNSEILFSTNDAKKFKKYLNQDRAKIINDISNIKNSDMLFLYDIDNVIFQIHMPNPLDDVRKIERILKKLAAAADILYVQPNDDCESEDDENGDNC